MLGEPVNGCAAQAPRSFTALRPTRCGPATGGAACSLMGMPPDAARTPGVARGPPPVALRVNLHYHTIFGHEFVAAISLEHDCRNLDCVCIAQAAGHSCC